MGVREGRLGVPLTLTLSRDGEKGMTEATSTSVTPACWGNPHSIPKDLGFFCPQRLKESQMILRTRSIRAGCN